MAKMTDLTTPYPQDHNDLLSKLKVVTEEIEKMDEKSKTFYDFTTLCKKRYYNSFLANFSNDGRVDYRKLKNFSISFPKERDTKNRMQKTRLVTLKKDDKGIVNPKVTIPSDKVAKWRKLVSSQDLPDSVPKFLSFLPKKFRNGRFSVNTLQLLS